MNKKLNFHGLGDDLLVCEGAEICGLSPLVYRLKSTEGELLIVGYYLDYGLWSIGIAQVSGNVPLPAWPVTYSVHECGYSSMLPSMCQTILF